jgi:hypothetical protein
MNPAWRSIWRATFVASVLGVCTAAAAQRGFPGFDSQASIADSSLDFELLSASLSATGDDLTVLLNARTRDQPAVATKLAVARIDAGGSAARAVFSAETDVESLRQDGAAMVVHNTLNGPHVLQLGPAGVRLHGVTIDSASKRAAFAGRRVIALEGITALRFAAPLPSNRFLLLGASRGRPLVAEIDAGDATVRWQRELDEPGLTLTSAQPIAGDGVLVVGARADAETRQEHVWAATLDAKGQVKVHTTFEGRAATAAVGSDGTIAVVYHRADGLKADVVLRALGPELDDKWERVLLPAQQAPPVFGIAAVANGHFVVAGAENRGLWVARVGADGAPIWLEKRVPTARPDMEMVVNVRLLRGARGLVMPYTAFVVDGGQQSEVVRVLRFPAD